MNVIQAREMPPDDAVFTSQVEWDDVVGNLHFFVAANRDSLEQRLNIFVTESEFFFHLV